MSRSPYRRATLALVALTASASLLVPVIDAGAQEPGSTDSLLERLHLKAKLAPAPPFMTGQPGRRGESFIPPGRTGAARPAKPMTPAELAAATAGLDAAREKQQRRAGRKPAIVPDKPAIAPAASNK